MTPLAMVVVTVAAPFVTLIAWPQKWRKQIWG